MIKLTLIILFVLNINNYFCLNPSLDNNQLINTNSDNNVRDNNDINEARKADIKGAFIHAWKGYKKFAWGKDELLPLNNTYYQPFQGWGVTLVDSLTTLWLMDLKAEFNEAVSVVEQIDFSKCNGKVNFFETTIRYLGGLIGAYDLSGNEILLKQAIRLADLLMIAFESPSGIPYSLIDFENGDDSGLYRGVALAAIGTCQLEFTRLSQITKDPKYEEKSMKVVDHLDKLKKTKVGLYSNVLDPITGEFISPAISFGAEGDSFYEYLIKVYLLTGRTNEKLKRMYLESIQGFKSLVRTRKSDGLTYFIRIDKFGEEESIMDHLGLFMGGLLQYGDFILNTKNNSELGLKITDTGYQFINISNTKLAPESILIPDNGPLKIKDPKNYLRPELLESLFYSWRFTKNPKYRDQAWEIFLAINKYSKTPSAFAIYKNVQSKNIKRQQFNSLESFFFAETLKYLYLIFSEDSKLDFNEFVLNTEAHPIKLNDHRK